MRGKRAVFRVHFASGFLSSQLQTLQNGRSLLKTKVTSGSWELELLQGTQQRP